MALTKVLLADQYGGSDAFDYINLGLIASIDVEGDHYIVTLGNRIDYKIAKNDVSITVLISASDTAYVAPS